MMREFVLADSIHLGSASQIGWGLMFWCLPCCGSCCYAGTSSPRSSQGQQEIRRLGRLTIQALTARHILGFMFWM